MGRPDLRPGKRVECLLEQAPGEWRWKPGTITALLLPEWPGWARVQFDSGDTTLEVKLPLESEGDAWRWADEQFDEELAAPERPAEQGVMYLPARRTHPSTAGAVAASEVAARSRASAVSAVPKRQRHVASTDSNQAADDVGSGDEEEHEPVLKRRKNSSAKSSAFVGVTWHKQRHKWKAQIDHDRKRQHLGRFDDEREAARAFDTAARRLRGDDAHGGRAGTNWNGLNFPTEEEVKRAKERGALLTEEDKRVAAAASEQQGPSAFVGVHWDKARRKWEALIRHGGKDVYLGRFGDEQEAARVVDMAARRLQGDEAHGGRSENGNWLRLNFPTKREEGRAKVLGMPAAR
jgi:hypothetical protein